MFFRGVYSSPRKEEGDPGWGESESRISAVGWGGVHVSADIRTVRCRDKGSTPFRGFADSGVDQFARRIVSSNALGFMGGAISNDVCA